MYTIDGTVIKFQKMEKNIRGTRHYTCTYHFSVYKVSASMSSGKCSVESRKFSGESRKFSGEFRKIFQKFFLKKCLECSDSSKKLKFLRIQTFSH